MTLDIEPVEVIRRAFPELSSLEAAEMVSLGSVESYAEGNMLCAEGAIERTFYILLEGEVKVTKVINEAEDRFLAILKPGDFFGEMALIQDAPRAASVRTVTPVVVLEIYRDHFEELVERNSRVSMAMVRVVTRRLGENNDLAIEDLRMKAAELANAYQRLAEEELARSEFLTVVAHELRTPLTVASGFIEMTRHQNIQGEMLYMALDTVSNNLQQIIALVNNILFLQEMEIILPTFITMDVATILTAIMEKQRSHAEQNSVGMSLSIAPNLPKVSADPNSLERALHAILDNAVKFSPGGGAVEVQAGSKGREVWIKVKDAGVGIPPEMQPKIFNRFFHLEEVGGYLFRGVGLGLSIAKAVIEMHQGRIEVESELGKGSTFTIDLPAQAVIN
jgi:signal transduction histidine kinase